MRPRFVGRLGLADAVTVSNAALGFGAALAATVDVMLAAKLLLLASIADGLDGVVARRFGSTPAGQYLDSLADVASFGVAPAMLVALVAREAWTMSTAPVSFVAGHVVPALFVAMAVVRLGLYTAYDSDSDETVGAPTTLAATLMGAAVLTGFHGATFLVVVTAVMTALMVSRVTYPDLHAHDALVMGVVQAGAILLPGQFGRGFAFALLYVALAYLLLAPRFYWR